MHPQLTVDRARRLSQLGVIDREVSADHGRPASDRPEMAHRRPVARLARYARRREPDCPRCTGRPLDEPAYSYLLGLYLGDGWLTLGQPGRLRAEHRVLRRLARSPVSREKRDVGGHARVQGIRCPENRHDRGQEHLEALAVLVPAARAWPQAHQKDRARRVAAGDRGAVSGGFRQRAVPFGRLPRCQPGAQDWGGDEHWYEYPRYLFTNNSTDILWLCGQTLDQLGVAWRFSKPNTISVARREAVARLDEFVGPKY